MRTILAFLIFSALGRSNIVLAQETDGLDSTSQEALVKTQQLLNDKTAREAAVSKDPKATQADEFTKNLTGNAKVTDEVYALAAEVFSIIVKDSKGDPNKMKEATDQFSRDPASFADKWTPEQKAKLSKLSGELPQPILNH